MKIEKIESYERLIIITQPIHEEIPDKVIVEALSAEMKDLPRGPVIEVKPGHIPHGSLDIHWKDLMRKQRWIFENDIKPLLMEGKNDLIAFFGIAPIPLTIHLGHLFGPTTTNIVVFQKYHGKATDEWPLWGYPKSTKKRPVLPFKRTISNLPTEKSEVSGDAIIRFETSFGEVEIDDCKAIIPTPLAKPYFAHLNRNSAFRKDPFTNESQLHAVAGDFSMILDSLHNHYPNMNAVHVFACVQPGIAFLMGREIYATTTKPVYCYQFQESLVEKYKQVFYVQEAGEKVFILTDDHHQQADSLRREIASSTLGDLRDFLKVIQPPMNQNWFEALDFDGYNPITLPFSERDLKWHGLAPAANNLYLSSCDLELDNVEQEKRKFFDSKNRKWILSDQVLHLIKERIEDRSRLARGIRLFFFHESLHFQTHNITPERSRNLGGFPSVLADADYQSDVYSFFHEYKYAIWKKEEPIGEAFRFFSELIEVTTEMMWAFDQLEDDFEMETRRMQRYLNLYWMQLQIEDLRCQDIDDIIKILHAPPVISFKGLEIRVSQNRPVAFLSEESKRSLSIAVMYKQKLRRYAHDPDTIDLEKMVQGFRERNGNMVLESLRAFSQTVLNP